MKPANEGENAGRQIGINSINSQKADNGRLGCVVDQPMRKRISTMQASPTPSKSGHERLWATQGRGCGMGLEGD